MSATVVKKRGRPKKVEKVNVSAENVEAVAQNTHLGEQRIYSGSPSKKLITQTQVSLPDSDTGTPRKRTRRSRNDEMEDHSISLVQPEISPTSSKRRVLPQAKGLKQLVTSLESTPSSSTATEATSESKKVHQHARNLGDRFLSVGGIPEAQESVNQSIHPPSPQLQANHEKSLILQELVKLSERSNTVSKELDHLALEISKKKAFASIQKLSQAPIHSKSISSTTSVSHPNQTSTTSSPELISTFNQMPPKPIPSKAPTKLPPSWSSSPNSSTRHTIPTHPPTPTPPARPLRPTEMPYETLRKDPRYKAQERKWMGLMVAIPVLIVTSYTLYGRYTGMLEQKRVPRPAESRPDAEVSA